MDRTSEGKNFSPTFRPLNLQPLLKIETVLVRDRGSSRVVVETYRQSRVLQPPQDIGVVVVSPREVFSP